MLTREVEQPAGQLDDAPAGKGSAHRPSMADAPLLASAGMRERGPIDAVAAQRAVHELLQALGYDPADTHLADTPLRVAKAYTELLTPVPVDPTTFPNDEEYD